MKPRTKGVSVIGVALLSVIVGLAVLNFGQSIGAGPFAKMTVNAAGIPDSYGNYIYQFIVAQNTSGSWTTITSVSYATFTNGTTLSIPANQKTILVAIVVLNKTLAADLGTASTRARIYITVSGVYTSSLMIYSSGAVGLTEYVLTYMYPATTGSPTSVWTPATDTTYTVTLQYQAYY